MQFQKQVEAVCDCYLEAPELAKNHNTHTVSVDEMTGLQALERIAPSKAMIAGKCQLIEFEYSRHGTLCLIGDLVVTTGELPRPTIGPTRTETTSPATSSRRWPPTRRVRGCLWWIT